MGCRYSYQFACRARDDLDDIVGYIAIDLGNPPAATAFVDELVATIDRVCCFPEIGTPVVNEFLSRSDVRRQLVKNYIMYYVPDHAARVITVLRIVYGRRNLDEVLAEIDL